MRWSYAAAYRALTVGSPVVVTIKNKFYDTGTVTKMTDYPLQEITIFLDSHEQNKLINKTFRHFRVWPATAWLAK